MLGTFVSAAEVITAPPTGTDYIEAYRSSQKTWMIYQGGIGSFTNDGFWGQIAIDGQDIYIYKYVSEIESNYWIKGTVKDGVAEFQFPQQIDEKHTINVLKPVIGVTGTNMVPTDDNVLRMSWDGTELRQLITPSTDPAAQRYDGLVGLLNADGAFAGYGEQGTLISKFEGTTATLPEGLEAEPYALTAVDDFNDPINIMVNIAVKDGEAYISGLNPFMTETWVRGIVTDGTIMIPTKEFMGLNEHNYYNFLYGATAVKENGKYSYTETAGVTLTPTEDGYAADCAIVINNGYMVLNPVRVMINARLTKMSALEQTPADPVIGSYEEEDGMGCVDFEIPTIDTNGMPLQLNNLYYNIILNGQPLTYEGEADIPYYIEGEADGVMLDNGMLIGAADGYKIVLTFELAETMQIRSVYRNGDKTTYSRTIEVATAGAADITTDAETVSSQYYTIGGAEAAAPGKGIYLRRDTRADGTTSVSKVVIR